jgi:hypothetical protein
MRLQPKNEYLQAVLAAQADLTGWGPEMVLASELPKGARYFEHQRAVNSGVPVPSERVVAEHIRREGTDYRYDSDAPRPIRAA